MKHIYAVTNSDDLKKYQSFVRKIQPKLQKYLGYLRTAFSAADLPRAILWTDAETATQQISDIPIPAYTNEYRTVFCPDIESWRKIYLKQLDGAENEEIRRYYETAMTENHLLQILGHEFVHHSKLFLDDAYEKAMWFEEGMCEYISRRYFLTDAEFDAEVRINALLVQQFEALHGVHPLEEFCSDTYANTYADIFYFYWRSFLAVNRIVAQFGGNVAAVFREYRRWLETGPSLPLTKWFHL